MPRKYPFLNAEVPSSEEVLKNTPNEGSRQLFSHLKEKGVESFLERFEAQQPQCRFGLTGTCCQRCLWGPCRLDPSEGSGKRRGICGADVDLVVAGNLLRSLAAGCSAHGTHAMEVVETIFATLNGQNTFFTFKGKERLLELAEKMELPSGGDESEKEFKKAYFIAKLLKNCIKGGEGAILKLMELYAPQEQLARWKEMDIIPRSALEEVFEALHLTTLGSCSDYKELLKQEMRTALAYCYGTLLPASLGQEILFGLPEPFLTPLEVNYGVLKENNVNILLHGHSPVVAEGLIQAVRGESLKKEARQAGAEKINLAGACCTGNAILSRHGIPTVANILAIELVLATGAVDALVLDMQCALPGLKVVAECFGGKVVTTYKGNRFPGDSHIPLSLSDPLGQAETIVRAALENFKARRGKKTFIPTLKTKAVAGWGVESFLRIFEGAEKLAELLAEGTIKGLVSIGGCNSPKTPYELDHVTIARELVRFGALIFTTGCASYSLLNAGLASPEAARLAPSPLKELLEAKGLAPVFPLGACPDNSRLLRIYTQVASALGEEVCRLPFCHSGPAPGSEKNIGQGVTFLLHGVSVHQGFPAGIPVPLPRPVKGSRFHDELEMDMSNVARFFALEAPEILGARVYSEPYPNLAAKTIQMHLHRQRLGLGWKG